MLDLANGTELTIEESTNRLHQARAERAADTTVPTSVTLQNSFIPPDHDAAPFMPGAVDEA